MQNFNDSPYAFIKVTPLVFREIYEHDAAWTYRAGRFDSNENLFTEFCLHVNVLCPEAETTFLGLTGIHSASDEDTDYLVMKIQNSSDEDAECLMMKIQYASDEDTACQ